ncbi:serine--tRNA ligase [Thermopetrobacter sp. TC1]|uniref:serine--tRNA ligase n=1 Tax=Thermopetrobacter sp. TC1 TaxID=1495045 RepID=UPI00056E1F85|nr:serine--tRNA ligase [Thermopetrobacter sp. TC1]
MFDIRWIREHPEEFDRGMARRGLAPQSEKLIALDEERRKSLTELQELQNRRNALSKEIGKAMAAGEKDRAEALKAEVAAMKQRLQELEEAAREKEAELRAALAALPNIPLDEVPDGEDESSNVEVRREGEPPRFDFEPKQHFELGEALGMMDFETAAKIAGSRFVILKGPLARLERALAQFMLDVQTGEHGYEEVNPPLLVRDEAVFGTGQLPKFEEDLFRTTDGRWLIPTAEVPLTNLVREQIVPQAKLPMRVCALTPCFRSEAGAAGRDTRGMIRQHQFEKVELVSITTPEEGRAELDRKLACAEEILKRLGLPYRVVLLCAGDMGFSASITFDLEVWLPGQNAYREISSVSLCGDFQARRMNARYRPEGEKKPRFVHTLNGSGLAVGRTLIAVMENYQNADGSITIPEALHPYMGGLERIGPPAA